MPEYHVQILILFFGGLVGWSLFLISLLVILVDRRKEIKMIFEISHELEKIRTDIEKLK